ncbi:MAG: polysaccharide biosynthesis protein [Thermaerobacterales bacterium]
MRRNTFLQGAFILAMGSLISRLLGALYRFFLPMMMGDDKEYGMGLLSYSLYVYSVVLTISSMGIPLAIARLVSERVARGDGAGALRVFQISGRVLATFGLLLTGGMVWIAFVFSRFYDPNALYAMLAIAPAVFVVSVMSAYRGLFQGLQVMTPFAVSQVVEQTLRIATIFLLAFLLLPLGIEFAAAGASFGAVTGAVASLIYLLVVYWRYRPQIANLTQGSGPVEPAISVVSQVLRLSIPMSLAALAFPLFALSDTVLVPLRLQYLGAAQEEATALLGVLSNLAMPFINLPTVFTTALALSIVPAVAEAFTAGDQNRITRITSAGMRVTMMITLPAAVGLGLLAYDIPTVLWNTPQVGAPLQILAPATLFIGLQQISSGTLQGLGLPMLPVRNLMTGLAVKLGLTWWLSGMPELGINGAAYATLTGFLVAAALNLTSVRMRVGTLSLTAGDVLRPAAAVVAMGLVVRFIQSLGFGPVIGLGLALSGGAASYGITLLVVGGLRGADLDMVPVVGSRLRLLLERLKLIRGGGDRP